MTNDIYSSLLKSPLIENAKELKTYYKKETFLGIFKTNNLYASCDGKEIFINESLRLHPRIIESRHKSIFVNSQ